VIILYYRKHRSEPHVRSVRWLLLGVLVVGVIITINALVHPIVENMLVNQSRIAFNDAVNRAVNNTIGEEMSASDFVMLTSDDSGRITSIQTNSLAVNDFRASLGTELAKELNGYSNGMIEIPIGTLSGIDFLMGCGPTVKLRLIQKGSITTDLISSFTSAGINQTCHTVNCVIDAEYYAIIPGIRIPVSLSSNVMIAQSIIVGEIPDSFTNVNGDQNDTIGRIFDYGDPYGEDVFEK